jgi:hypothetical protein
VKTSKRFIAKTQIDTAIQLFLSDTDFVSALTLAGAAEEILGAFIKRENDAHILGELHAWYQETMEKQIDYGQFSQNANFTRNSLKHAKGPSEDTVEVFRWETVQMLMRAMVNWRLLGYEPDKFMLKFNAWLKANAGAYESME